MNCCKHQNETMITLWRTTEIFCNSYWNWWEKNCLWERERMLGSFPLWYENIWASQLIKVLVNKHCEVAWLYMPIGMMLEEAEVINWFSDFYHTYLYIHYKGQSGEKLYFLLSANVMKIIISLYLFNCYYVNVS